MSSSLEDSCIFCAIIQGKISSFQILETELSYAFLDINPVAEGHTLVLPKYHAKKIVDLPDEYLSDIGPILKKVAKATGADQFNVLQNNGELAFQSVGHVHFHIIPKPSPTEGLVVSTDNWPVKTVDKEELARIAEKIKAAL